MLQQSLLTGSICLGRASQACTAILPLRALQGHQRWLGCSFTVSEHNTCSGRLLPTPSSTENHGSCRRRPYQPTRTSCSQQVASSTWHRQHGTPASLTSGVEDVPDLRARLLHTVFSWPQQRSPLSPWRQYQHGKMHNPTRTTPGFLHLDLVTLPASGPHVPLLQSPHHPSQ